MSVSIQPLYADCVELSNLDKSLRHDIKALAVLGANEGKLPAKRSDTALLNDANLAALMKNGMRVAPDAATLGKKRQTVRRNAAVGARGQALRILS